MDVELSTLNVGTSYQRKGLGGRLMDWGINELERRQVPGLIVATEAGYELYSKRGFEGREIWDEDLTRWGGSGNDMNAVLTRYPKKREKAV